MLSMKTLEKDVKHLLFTNQQIEKKKVGIARNLIKSRNLFEKTLKVKI